MGSLPTTSVVGYRISSHDWRRGLQDLTPLGLAYVMSAPTERDFVAHRRIEPMLENDLQNQSYPPCPSASVFSIPPTPPNLSTGI